MYMHVGVRVRVCACVCMCVSVCACFSKCPQSRLRILKNKDRRERNGAFRMMLCPIVYNNVPVPACTCASPSSRIRLFRSETSRYCYINYPLPAAGMGVFEVGHVTSSSKGNHKNVKTLGGSYRVS